MDEFTTCPNCGHDIVTHEVANGCKYDECDAHPAGIRGGFVPWTYAMLDYGGDRYIERLGPLGGGDTDYGEGYGVIYGNEAMARFVCSAVNAFMDARRDE